MYGFEAPLNAIIFIIAFIVAGYKAIWKSYVCINACWADVGQMHARGCVVSKAVEITFTRVSMRRAEYFQCASARHCAQDRMASVWIPLFRFGNRFKIDMFRNLCDNNTFRRNAGHVANRGAGWAVGECVCVGHCSLWCGNNKFIRREPPQAWLFPRALSTSSPSAAASLGLCHN